MDPLFEARDFLQKLSDYQYTLDLIQERVGSKMLTLMQGFVGQSVPENPQLQARIAGFMVMGYLLHGHLERRAIEERLGE